MVQSVSSASCTIQDRKNQRVNTETTLGQKTYRVHAFHTRRKRVDLSVLTCREISEETPFLFINNNNNTVHVFKHAIDEVGHFRQGI